MITKTLDKTVYTQMHTIVSHKDYQPKNDNLKTILKLILTKPLAKD